MFELIPQGTKIDFVGMRLPMAIGSTVAAVLAIVVFFFVGPNWSIDFTGGTKLQLQYQQEVSLQEVRDALEPVGVAEDAILQLGEEADHRFVIRMQGKSEADPEEVAKVKSALTAAFGADWIDTFDVDAEVGTRATIAYKGTQVDFQKITDSLASLPEVKAQSSTEENTFYVRLPGIAENIEAQLTKTLAGKTFTVESVDAVGAKVGGELKHAAILSLGMAMALLMVYIGIRFDFTFAPGAIICILHDTLITTGVYVLTGQEFGLSMISALLTLVGYSLNDTVIVYDRIRETSHRYRRKNFGECINDSINQTLSRTIVTSGATMLAMIPFLFWGGPVLSQFAQVMLFGIAIGTYSSVYVAAPLTMVLQEHSGSLRKLFGGKAE